MQPSKYYFSVIKVQLNVKIKTAEKNGLYPVASLALTRSPEASEF